MMARSSEVHGCDKESMMILLFAFIYFIFFLRLFYNTNVYHEKVTRDERKKKLKQVLLRSSPSKEKEN